MKTLIAFLFAVSLVVAAESPAPRVVSLASGPHPKAQIVSVDSPSGTLTFAYLKADGTRADSGNSIARFTPVAPVAPVPPSTVPTYPAPSDSTLAAAIIATQ